MKKIGIVTLTGYFNYGNRLQNYALQRKLEDFGFQTDTIVNTPEYQTRKIGYRSYNRGYIYRYAAFVYHRVFTRSKKKDNLDLIRESHFKNFTSKYIKETRGAKLSKKYLESINQKYDFFVTGSDQVWNPGYIKVGTINFLDFANKEKRISYAASFGVSSIPEYLKDNYTHWLNGFKSISVREDTGKELVESLSNKNATVVVDPTMLLTKEEWDEIRLDSIVKPTEPYILTYFLGEKSDELIKAIDYLSTKHSLKVINLADKSDVSTYQTGPSEFLEFIHSSAIFLTDSFHGAVFSIIYQKPFVVYNRTGSSMFSRIDTLLDKFNLKERKAENLNFEEDVFSIDFRHTIDILELEREVAYDFLRDALDMKGK